MKPSRILKPILTLAIATTTAVVFSSCAAITGSQAGQRVITSLPEPLKGQFQEITRQQALLGEQYTAGTRKLLEAYAMIGDAIGLKKQSGLLREQANLLSKGSSFDDSRKAFSRSQSLIAEVQKAMGSSEAVTLQSKQAFVSGVRTKNEAYLIEVNLAMNASIQTAKGIQAMKSASLIEKAALTTTLDPLFYLSKDLPRFLESERQFEKVCQEFAAKNHTSIPKTPLPTPKLSLPVKY